MISFDRSTVLCAKRRTHDLDALQRDIDTVDLLVIGGGITGVGTALDAASRGLSVVLVESHDFGFGTSRWSSKLIHGGLRYLASGNVGIAHRSAVERGVLMEHTAPHLVSRIGQVLPVLPGMTPLQMTLPRLGFIAGDMLRITAGTKGKTLPLSKTISARHAIELSPTIRREGLKCAYLNYDGQLIDDARLVTAIARTAAQFGARVLNHASAIDVTGQGATIVDKLSGTEFPLQARTVINATGVWAGSIDSSIRIRPSRGTHLIFRAETFGNPTAALTVPLPGSTSRYVFVLPEQLGRVYLGLTDEPSEIIEDVPTVPEVDVDFLLDAINRALDVKVGRDDIIGAFAGLRPLIDTGSGATSDLSRDHAIIENESGVISIVGGKLTEYRLMAEQVVDEAVRKGSLDAAPCWTKRLAIVGAPTHRDSRRVDQSEMDGLPASLVSRFGYESPRVVAESLLDKPLEPVAEGIDVIRAEFSYAITHEGALSTGDILDRRTRIGLVETDRELAEPAAMEALALLDTES